MAELGKPELVKLTSEVTKEEIGGWRKVVPASADALTTALPPSLDGMDEDGCIVNKIHSLKGKYKYKMELQ